MIVNRVSIRPYLLGADGIWGVPLNSYDRIRWKWPLHHVLIKSWRAELQIASCYYESSFAHSVPFARVSGEDIPHMTLYMAICFEISFTTILLLYPHTHDKHVWRGFHQSKSLIDLTSCPRHVVQR